MREHGEGGEGDSRGGGDETAALVGVGRARERVGPGKWLRVATLASQVGAVGTSAHAITFVWKAPL